VAPAAAAGMLAVFLRRGPWGFLQAEHPDAAGAQIQLDSLDALPQALEAYSVRCPLSVVSCRGTTGNWPRTTDNKGATLS